MVSSPTKRRLILWLVPALVCLLLPAIPGYTSTGPEPAGETSYFEMSLEDLMHVTVVTPSTFDQTVSEACATINVPVSYTHLTLPTN